MRGLLQDNAALAADACLAWWAQAGVDSAIAEAPVNWLRPATHATATSLVTPPPQEKPPTLESFHAWSESDPAQPERRWPGAPIRAVGPASAALMVITDLPDPADMAANMLLTDRPGILFDAMLHAIGLSRDTIYLASLFTARPPGGMVEAADLALAASRMRTHVALAAPRRLLILGDRTIRALLPTNGDQDSGNDANALPGFNHEGGIVSAVATFHPRLLLTQPTAKAECWRVLQSLIEENRP